MLQIEIFLLAIAGTILQAQAGCRYTNPEWDTNGTKSAPSIQVAVTSSELKLVAKWDATVVGHARHFSKTREKPDDYLPH